jgi:inhibitor of cysteine peptidase
MSPRWLSATILGAAILTAVVFSLGVEGGIQVQVLREQDAGKTVDVPVGDVIEIRLSENPTTGYRWTIAQSNEKICSIVRDEFIAPVNHVLGAGGEHIWQFRAMAPGDCEIELVYSRSSSNADQRIYRIRLHVP